MHPLLEANMATKKCILMFMSENWPDISCKVAGCEACPKGWVMPGIERAPAQVRHWQAAIVRVADYGRGSSVSYHLAIC